MFPDMFWPAEYSAIHYMDLPPLPKASGLWTIQAWLVGEERCGTGNKIIVTERMWEAMQNWKHWSPLPYALFNNERCREFMKAEVSIPELRDMYARGIREKWHASRLADIWRIAFLYERGGLYIDVDAQPSSSFHDIIKPEHDFLCPRSHELVNWFMFCRFPRHPILAHTIDIILEREPEKLSIIQDDVIYRTGPEALTAGYRRAMSVDPNLSGRKVDFISEKGIKPFSWLTYPIIFKYSGYTVDVETIQEGSEDMESNSDLAKRFDIS